MSTRCQRLCWTLFFFVACLAAATHGSSVVIENFHRVYKGVDLQSPCLAMLHNIRSVISCILRCAELTACGRGSYHSVRKSCCLGNGTILDRNAVYVEDENSRFFLKRTDHIWHDGWALAFKAIAGTNQSFYSVYKSGYYDDNPVGKNDLDFGCLTLSGAPSCKSHFRSVLLDTWETVAIQEVSLRLYKNGTEVVNVVFNGTGSTVITWMVPERLLLSPWDDASTIAADYNYFGVDIADFHERYFFINRNYGGCHNDAGWLCALDPLNGTRPFCPWEEGPVPAFFYSNSNHSITWQDTNATKERADVLAVFVKF